MEISAGDIVLRAVNRKAACVVGGQVVTLVRVICGVTVLGGVVRQQRRGEGDGAGALIDPHVAVATDGAVGQVYGATCLG